MGKDWNEENSITKAKRLGIIEQRPASTNKTKLTRPWVLECLSPYRCHEGLGWRKWKAYRSEDEANKVRDHMMRKLSSYSWRVVNLTNA
jgi:hypothetical protein